MVHPNAHRLQRFILLDPLGIIRQHENFNGYQMELDALIIGAGPAGSATALLLAQAGWSVGIIEKKTFPRRKVCGEFISATNLPLLYKLGIADFYLKYGGPEVKQVGLFTANTRLISKMPSLAHSFGHWGRALGRDLMDSKLLEMAKNAGAKIWQPAEVKKLHSGKNFTCIITSNRMMNEKKMNEVSETISTPIVIMAHGSWEKAIHEEQNHFHHQSADLLAFKAHFRNTSLEPDLMPLITFPGGYGGLVQSDNGRTTFSCCIRRDVLKQVRKNFFNYSAGEAVLAYVKNNCLGVREVLSSAQLIGNWLAAGPIRPGIRKRYHAGLFYVGNIAGEAHPVIAEGISMALQSAWLLTQTLLKHPKNIDLAGKEYAKQWSKHFSSRIYAAALFAQITMRPKYLNLLLPFLERFPNMLTIGAKLSGKIRLIIPDTY